VDAEPGGGGHHAVAHVAEVQTDLLVVAPVECAAQFRVGGVDVHAADVDTGDDDAAGHFTGGHRGVGQVRHADDGEHRARDDPRLLAFGGLPPRHGGGLSPARSPAAGATAARPPAGATPAGSVAIRSVTTRSITTR